MPIEGNPGCNCAVGSGHERSWGGAWGALGVLGVLRRFSRRWRRTRRAAAAVTVVAVAACHDDASAPQPSFLPPLRSGQAGDVDAIVARDSSLARFFAGGDADTTGFVAESLAFESAGWRANDVARHRVLGVRAPRSAHDVVDVGVGRLEHARLRMTLEGALAVPGVLDQGRVVYAGALPGTDRVIAATRDAFEDMLVLTSPEAPTTFAWHVAPSAELAHAAMRDGGLELADEGGRVALRIAPPHVVDAHGIMRDAALTWDFGAQLMRIAFDASGLAYPIVLDPSIDLGVWLELARLPAGLPRYAGGSAFDGARGEMVVFGGQTSFATTDINAQTWTWNGAAWTWRTTAVAPSARTQAAMTYDGARRVVLLFGGTDSNNTTSPSMSDTWTWNGTAWTLVAGAAGPAMTGSLAFDAARGEDVLVGNKQSRDHSG